MKAERSLASDQCPQNYHPIPGATKNRRFNPIAVRTKVIRSMNFWYRLMRWLHEYRERLWDKGGSVSFKGLNRTVAAGLLLLGVWAATSAPVWGQEEIARKVRTKVA